MNRPLTLGVAAALLIAGGQAYAQGTCPASTTVSHLEGMGLPIPFSCTIDDATLSNFSFTTAFQTQFSQSLLDFSTPSPGVVDVTLSSAGHQAGLPFGTNSIGYHITGINGMSILSTLVSPSSLELTTRANVSGTTLVAGQTIPVNAASATNFAEFNVRGTGVTSVSQAWNVGTAPPPPPPPVPEPMSLSLFGIGLAGLALARRRRS